MSCHDSGKSRGDINIEQFHDVTERLASDSSSGLECLYLHSKRKRCPLATVNSSQLFKSIAEMVTAQTLATLAPKGNAMENATAMASKLGEPINTDCPIKPGRAIDPSLLALNEDGETVGFCCQSCLNQFKRTMADMKNKSRPSSTSSASTVSYVRDRNSVRASEVGSPAPNGHLIREFGGSDRDQIENSHKQASVTQVLNLLNGYVEQRILGKRCDCSQQC